MPARNWIISERNAKLIAIYFWEKSNVAFAYFAEISGWPSTNGGALSRVSAPVSNKRVGLTVKGLSEWRCPLPCLASLELGSPKCLQSSSQCSSIFQSGQRDDSVAELLLMFVIALCWKGDYANHVKGMLKNWGIWWRHRTWLSFYGALKRLELKSPWCHSTRQ